MLVPELILGLPVPPYWINAAVELHSSFSLVPVNLRSLMEKNGDLFTNTDLSHRSFVTASRSCEKGFNSFFITKYVSFLKRTSVEKTALAYLERLFHNGSRPLNHFIVIYSGIFVPYYLSKTFLLSAFLRFSRLFQFAFVCKSHAIFFSSLMMPWIGESLDFKIGQVVVSGLIRTFVRTS